MWINAKCATKILLGVNIMLMPGFVVTLMYILFENNPGLYRWTYNAIYEIQHLIIYSWFFAIILSPVLAIAFSFFFGSEIRKTTQWKISIVIMVLIGIPSLLFVVMGVTMNSI